MLTWARASLRTGAPVGEPLRLVFDEWIVDASASATGVPGGDYTMKTLSIVLPAALALTAASLGLAQNDPVKAVADQPTTINANVDGWIEGTVLKLDAD